MFYEKYCAKASVKGGAATELACYFIPRLAFIFADALRFVLEN